MIITAEKLRDCVRAIFVAEGCSEEESRRIGLYLVRSNLAGHDSHGVVRVPRYVALLRDGLLVAGRGVDVILRSETLAVLDAGYGFGPTVGPLAIQTGIDMALSAGVAVVALRNAGHLGRIGEWAEMTANAGLACVHFVNVAGSVLVAPFGGVDRRFSTAPFAAGFPVLGKQPLILDFATSAVAEGKVLIAANGGKALSPHSLITPTGDHSGDPATLYGNLDGPGPRSAKNGTGAIRAFGEHKGSGLALFCELLAGALTGSGCCGPAPRPFANGMLSIYFRPSAFGATEQFATETEAFLGFVQSSRSAEPGGKVLLPGQAEASTRAERTANGVPLSDEVWASIVRTAEQAGVTIT